MATRYSGELVIRAVYNDGSFRELPHYKVSVSHPASGGTGSKRREVWKSKIAPTPYQERVAFDSPRAYTSIAKSALSFAADDGFPVEEYAAITSSGNGWYVGTTPATAWEKGSGGWTR